MEDNQQLIVIVAIAKEALMVVWVVIMNDENQIEHHKNQYFDLISVASKINSCS